MSEGAAVRRAVSERRTVEGDVFQLPPTTSRPALLAGGSDRRFRQLLYDLSVLGVHLTTLRGIIAPALRLTPPQYNVLMVVAQYQGEAGVSVRKVADHLHVSGAFVTAEANKLTRRGMTTKRDNPVDRRGVLLKLSAAAELAIAEAAPFIRAINDRAFGALTRTEFAQLSEIAAKLVASVSATAEWAPGASPATVSRRRRAKHVARATVER
jgi:DNA-binding MarR family transcriptional regulator